MSTITEELSRLAGSWVVTPSFPVAPLPPAVVQLCQPSPLRWGLVLALPEVTSGAASPVNVGPTPQVNGSQGWGLTAGAAIRFNYREHPGLVQSAWYAASAGASPQQVTVIQELAQQ